MGDVAGLGESDGRVPVTGGGSNTTGTVTDGTDTGTGSGSGSGSGSTYISGVVTSTKCNDTLAFADLMVFIQNLIPAIEKFFPTIKVTTTKLAAMEISASVPPVVFVRLVWVKQNKGVAFSKLNLYQLLQLEFIYSTIGLLPLWAEDPLYSAYLTASAPV